MVVVVATHERKKPMRRCLIDILLTLISPPPQKEHKEQQLQKRQLQQQTTRKGTTKWVVSVVECTMSCHRKNDAKTRLTWMQPRLSFWKAICLSYKYIQNGAARSVLQYASLAVSKCHLVHSVSGHAQRVDCIFGWNTWQPNSHPAPHVSSKFCGNTRFHFKILEE